MDSGIKLINASGVNDTGIGVVLNQFGRTNTVSRGLPNVNSIFPFVGTKTHPFSCTGGIL